MSFPDVPLEARLGLTLCVSRVLVTVLLSLRLELAASVLAKFPQFVVQRPQEAIRLMQVGVCLPLHISVAQQLKV